MADDDQPTREQPPAEDQPADETTVLPPTRPSPDETTVMPTAEERPQWSARAAVPATGPRRPAPDQQWVPDQPPRTWWAPILIGVAVLVLVGLIALGLWVSMRSPTGTGASPSPSPSASSSSPSPSPSPSASPTGSPTPPVSMVNVPSVRGVSVSDAEQILQSQGLNWKVTTRVSGADTPGTVIETNPPAGTQVPAGTKVILVVATPPATSAAPSPSAS